MISNQLLDSGYSSISVEHSQQTVVPDGFRSLAYNTNIVADGLKVTKTLSNLNNSHQPLKKTNLQHQFLKTDHKILKAEENYYSYEGKKIKAIK